MKTLVLSFRKRTENSSFLRLSRFIKLINAYTLYADAVLCIDGADDKAFVDCVNGDFDCVFVLDSDLATFSYANLLMQLGYSADGNGFCFAKKLISLVPDDFEAHYCANLESALKTHFGTCVQKVKFKLYGLTNQEITDITNGICDKFDGVYILVGEETFFRRAEPIFEIDDYYIVRAESEEEKTEKAAEEADKSEDASAQENELSEKPKSYKYLTLYDSIVTGGKELYDGKRIS